MNKREYCHRLADINEALYDIEKRLRDVKFKLMWENNPDRRDWFQKAEERLLRERAETKESRTALEAEGYSALE